MATIEYTMSVRERIPDKLTLGEELVAISLQEDVEVFQTNDYVMLEIAPDAGRLNIPRIANTIYDLVKEDRKMVAVRGYGFKGIGLGVRIAHDIKKKEERFKYEMAFDTFEAAKGKDGRPLTSVQIVIIPPE